MLTIGCHLSSSKGYLHMAKEAVSIGANTFQFFTRNPRGGAAKSLKEGDIAAFRAYAAEHGFPVILAHAPYTLNPCAKPGPTREFARQVMAEDLVRMEATPGQMYNFHPGCHVGQGMKEAVKLVAECVNQAMQPGQTTTLLLETMAGKGTEVGSRFEELRAIIDLVEDSARIGVCLDTCHVYDGGYDLVHRLDDVLQEFDQIIGLDRLKAVHINDSKNPFNSHKDRHEKIGMGSLGTETFVNIINHPALQGLPFFLETPNELPGYAAEIALLREKYQEKSGNGSRE